LHQSLRLVLQHRGAPRRRVPLVGRPLLVVLAFHLFGNAALLVVTPGGNRQHPHRLGEALDDGGEGTERLARLAAPDDLPRAVREVKEVEHGDGIARRGRAVENVLAAEEDVRACAADEVTAGPVAQAPALLAGELYGRIEPALLLRGVVEGQ